MKRLKWAIILVALLVVLIAISILLWIFLTRKGVENVETNVTPVPTDKVTVVEHRVGCNQRAPDGKWYIKYDRMYELYSQFGATIRISYEDEYSISEHEYSISCVYVSLKPYRVYYIWLEQFPSGAWFVGNENRVTVDTERSTLAVFYKLVAVTRVSNIRIPFTPSEMCLVLANARQLLNRYLNRTALFNGYKTDIRYFCVKPMSYGNVTMKTIYEVFQVTVSELDCLAIGIVFSSYACHANGSVDEVKRYTATMISRKKKTSVV